MALVSEFQKALAANSTSTAFTATLAAVVATEPSGTGVFDLMSPAYGYAVGSRVPSYIVLMPFGDDGDGDTFDLRLYGYNKLAGASLWVPQLLTDLSVVLSSACDATSILAGSYLADTITVNDGAADNGPWASKIDCQEDMPATALIHTRGCRYIRFDFDSTTLNTDCNCLWRVTDI